MLNSNKVRHSLFKKEDLYQLTTKRLKAFLKACETKQKGFKYFEYYDETRPTHVSVNPEGFDPSVVEEYKTWSANMTLIRAVLKERLNPSEPYYSTGVY